MDSSLPFIVDPYALLDNRTRERLIPAAGAPAGRYLSLEHDGETKLIALERPITHIGRGLVADVRLEDSQVSRRHAILAVRGDGARLLDDRSYNGTFVNGRRVTVASPDRRRRAALRPRGVPLHRDHPASQGPAAASHPPGAPRARRAREPPDPGGLT